MRAAVHDQFGLCGQAPNIELLILFRVFQGLGGGGLQPSEQGVLVDTFPPRQLGMAMAMYGVAVIAPRSSTRAGRIYQRQLLLAIGSSTSTSRSASSR